MDIILSGTLSITMLVQDILDLEAIEAGDFPLNPERMDVRKIVRELERKVPPPSFSARSFRLLERQFAVLLRPRLVYGLLKPRRL